MLHETTSAYGLLKNRLACVPMLVRLSSFKMRSLKHSTVLALAVVSGAACCLLAMRTTAQIAPGDGLAAIQVRMAQLESDLHKAQAIRDIKRLQYSYAHYAELGLWFDLGDLFAANASRIICRAISEGRKACENFISRSLAAGSWDWRKAVSIRTS